MPGDERLLAGEVAVVTGGASGIGRATARRFAEHGAAVAVLDIDADAAQALATETGGSAYAVDVTDFTAFGDAVDRLTADLGAPTLLFNNAGGSSLSRVGDQDLEQWQQLVALNLTGVFHGLKLLAPRMAAAGRGSIVNTASISGVRPAAGEGPYAAAKAGVVALTQVAALEYAPAVRINAVSPGAVHTKMTDPLLTGIPGAKDWWIEKTPLGRIGEPEDIADVVLFLSSPLARFITGQNLVVDGGMTLHGSGVDGVLDRLERGAFAAPERSAQ